MHTNGVYSRLSQELAQAEARLMARLEALEAKLDALVERLSTHTDRERTADHS